MYQRYISENEDKTNAEICDIIIEENDVLKQLQKKSIMRRLQHERRVMEGTTKVTMVSNDKMKCSWSHDPVSKTYSFDLDGQDLIMSEDMASFICNAYTQPSGMSASSVASEYRKKFNVSPTEMNEAIVVKIVGLFEMTKSSPPFAPHEVIAMDSDSLVKMTIKKKREKIEEALGQDAELISLRKAYTEEVANNIHLKKYINSLGKIFGTGMIDKSYAESRIFSNVVDNGGMMGTFKRDAQNIYVDTDGSIRRKQVCVMPGTNAAPVAQEVKKNMHVVMSDWHIGKKTKIFNHGVAVSRVSRFVNEVIIHAAAHKVTGIYVHIMGDMVDGPSGTMHPEQWAHQDLHGIDQIEKASDLMADAILAIHRRSGGLVKFINAIGGNHGRFVPDRNDDPGRMADILAYKLTQTKINSIGGVRDLSYLFKIVSDENMFLDAHKGMCIIGHHGDKFQKDPISTIWEIRETCPEVVTKMGKGRGCWVWLHGHLHCNVFEEVQTNIYSLRGGSLAGPDDYTLRIGKGARASQMAFIHDETNDSISPIWVALD